LLFVTRTNACARNKFTKSADRRRKRRQTIGWIICLINFSPFVTVVNFATTLRRGADTLTNNEIKIVDKLITGTPLSGGNAINQLD
jgi:hypothetical protein